MDAAAPSIRFITYLSPSLPRRLFELVARSVGEKLNVPVSLQVEERFSGPPPGEPDPFSQCRADVGFVCSVPYLWLSAHDPPPVTLLAAAPVFDDPRVGGAPLYFSDVIVARSSGFGSLSALRGARWAYNDTCSLSGYLSLIRRLAAHGESTAFFREVRQSGSHLESMQLVARGDVDAAAIDSNVLSLWMRANPALRARLRVLESWGPFPIQPVVARATLDPDLRRHVTQALLSLSREEETRLALAQFGMLGFEPFADGLYEAERATFAAGLESFLPESLAGGETCR